MPAQISISASVHVVSLSRVKIARETLSTELSNAGFTFEMEDGSDDVSSPAFRVYHQEAKVDTLKDFYRTFSRGHSEVTVILKVKKGRGIQTYRFGPDPQGTFEEGADRAPGAHTPLAALPSELHPNHRRAV